MRDFILRLAFVCAFFPFLTNAQILAWDFTGETTVSTSSAEVVNSNLAGFDLLTRGSGAAASAGVNSFRTTGFQNDGIAVSNTDYFQFTLQAASGYELSISSVEARFNGTSSFAANSGVSHQYAYSLDGTNFTLIGSPVATISAPAQLTSDFSGVTALQNVPSGTTVTIRYYASGQTTTGGWGFHSPSAGTYGLAVFGALTLAACETESFISETACGSFDFFGTTLTTSGNYQHILTGANAAGCDSTVNLTLTIVSGFTYYEDFDGDGLGNPNSTIEACSLPAGYVENADDCDDTDDQIGAASEVYYVDADGDGFGAGNPILFCSDPGAGYATNNDDCNDTNYSIYPGAPEIPDDGIDQDCDGQDASAFGTQLGIYLFTGHDGCTAQDVQATTSSTNVLFSDYATNETSCAAGSGFFNNSNWNIGTDIDLAEYNEFTVSAVDCIELTLTKLEFLHRTSSTGGTPNWTVRSSLDNFTVDIATGMSSSSDQTSVVILPSEFDGIIEVTFRFYVTNIGSSGATWRNDNVAVFGFENAIPPLTYYADSDGDGFGDFNNFVQACSQPEGYVLNDGDCDDMDASINPNTVWYLDADGDGYGDNNTAVQNCEEPLGGYVLIGGDCDDTNEEVNPSAPEVCNGIDDNCNGLIDAEDPDVEDAEMYYVDEDEDGYGVGDPILFCSNPGPGYATVAGDCNDQNPDVNPGVSEICNGEDTDCNGLVDDGLEFTTYYVDADGDGFGAGDGIEFCADPGEGYSTLDGDCNDEDPTIYPGAEEIADDGIDQDCDGEDLSTASIAKNDWVKFDLVPNPSTGKVTVRFNQNVHDTDVTIFALTGQQVASFKVNGTSAVLNLSHFNDGVYLVRIRSDRGEHTSRLILAK